MIEYTSHLYEYTYNEYVALLLEKYGPVPRDYFANSNCKSKPRENSRSSDGLEIHHIDEDKVPKLSDERVAISHSFEYQKSDRLVYCNYLEHLVLHVLIYQEYTQKTKKCKKNNSYNDLQLGIPGVETFMIPRLNRMYCTYSFSRSYEASAFALIKNHYNDYIHIVRHVLSLLIENNKTKSPDELINKLSSGMFQTRYKLIEKIKTDITPTGILNKQTNEVERIKSEFCEDFGCSACLSGECSAHSAACEAYLSSMGI